LKLDLHLKSGDKGAAPEPVREFIAIRTRGCPLVPGFEMQESSNFKILSC